MHGLRRADLEWLKTHVVESPYGSAERARWEDGGLTDEVRQVMRLNDLLVTAAVPVSGMDIGE